MKIRPASLSDADGICRVHRASVTGLCNRDYTPEQIQAWIGTRKPKDYERPIEHTVFFVAEEKDKDIVGFSFLGQNDGVIHAVYVHPDHTGHGVGAALLVALEEEARSFNLEKVTLNATLNAVTFYKARGYSSLGEAVNTLPSGIDLPCVSMEKRLLETDRTK